MISLFKRFSSVKGETPKLFYSTDIHSHLCPGIDDGAPDLSTAVKLATALCEFGVTNMIITPHVTDEIFPNTTRRIAESFECLVDEIAKSEINLNLTYSAEYRIDDLFLARLKARDIIILPNNFVLVENSWHQEISNLDELLFSIQTDYGLRPILAHPERYHYYQLNKPRLSELHSKGVCFQVNILSLAGRYGKLCKQTAEWLLTNNMIDFVGSDIHHQGHIDDIRRYLNSRDYIKLLSKKDNIKNDVAFI